MRRVLASTFIFAFLTAASAWAAPPTSVLVEGAVTSAGGGAAADGDYDLTFKIYPSATSKTVSWTEGPVKVSVKAGRFAHPLGGTKALTPGVIDNIAQAWLSVTIGKDPELPRRRLLSTPFALVASRAKTVACTGCITAGQVANGGISAAKVGFTYAASATKGGPASDLACTGCVSVKELKFDGPVDLGANSLKGKNASFSGALAAATVTAVKFQGDGSALTGIKMPSGACAAGKVVAGINADGSLKCVAGGVSEASLPADGLNEVSNNLLSNQFIDTIKADKTNIPIPDNQGTDAVSNLTFPNIGQAQTFDLAVNVANTDLGTLALAVMPPNDKKTGWVLCDPCGKTDSKSLSAVYNVKNPPKSGNIGAWIGKNPQGLWNLKAKDTKFCVPQAPGNEKLCDPKAKTDGAILGWSIKIQTLSNQKVAVNADLYSNGGLKLGGDKSPCGAPQKGMLRWTATGGLQMCNGASWGSINRPAVYRGFCSLDRRYSSSHNYFCLDQTQLNTAGEYLTVSTYKPPSGTSSSTSYDKYWHSNAYKTGRVTIKKDGYYRVHFHNYSRGYTYSHIRLLLNGAEVKYTYDSDANAYQYYSQDIHNVMKLKAGNYLEFTARTNADNSTAYAIQSSGGTKSFVEIEFIGRD